VSNQGQIYHQNEIDSFIAENIKNFNCDKGWHNLIKSFLTELLNAGYDKNSKIFGKEKFGGLRISIGVNNVAPIFLNISRKYEIMSATICELCGEPGKHRTINGWEQTLCTSHFIKRYPVIEIESFNFDKVFRVEFEWGYERVRFYTRSFLALGNESLYGSANSTQINYYALLKAIPQIKFDDKDRLYVNRFFSNLSDCSICGYKAVFIDKCYYCRNEKWNGDAEGEWPNLNYSTEQDYIKELQMDWELDEDDYRKLRTLETLFEQSVNHQILFTDDDLALYVKEQSEL
jgi:hypothetical protein